jgi:hypothetical protein
MQILDVKKEGLKTIEKRQQLYTRLQDKGYKFIDKVKEGRKMYYIIEKQSDEKEIYNNIVHCLFNTLKEAEFTKYFLTRIANINKPITKELLSKNCEVHRRTITKWDNKMLEHKLLSKDGFFYISVTYDKEGRPTCIITTKEEYDGFMKCSKHVRQKQRILQQYKEDKINFDECQLLLDGIILNQKTIENRFVYRVNKFQLIKNNYLMKDILDYIELIYDKTLFDYYIDWMESKIN